MAAYEPLIVIGAPRSGTNMLRDALCRLPGLGTWPCDEINHLWRYGNPAYPTDELPAELATAPVAAYIESKFAALAKRQKLQIVVEKTCANSLRIPYVDAILPNARYVLIHRDPVDCVASAIKRWRAPIDWRYTLRKARFVPARDTGVYALRYLRNRAHRLVSGAGRVASWGPVYEGMHDDLARCSLAEVCALQWRACVERASESLERLGAGRWWMMSYEDFVRTPARGLKLLCDRMDLQFDANVRARAVGGVSPVRVGRGRAGLSRDAVARLEALTAPGARALARLNRSVSADVPEASD